MQRVETYILKKTKNKKDYLALRDICHNSKNLYNYVNYIIRQCQTNKLENIPDFKDLIRTSKKIVKSKKDGSEKQYVYNSISEFDLSKRLCELNQTDYKSLKAKVSQQTIKVIFKSYKSFFKSISDYYKNLSKYKGKPRLPKYKDKDGLFEVVYTNQSASITNDGYLKLSKELILKSVRTQILKRNFKQVRIIPKNDYFQIEIVYEKQQGDYTKQAINKNKKTYNAAIDIGVDNLATITSDNPDSTPVIINGRSLKSINQYYNKKLAELNQIYSKHKIHTGKKLHKLNYKREMIINDYLHKVSRRIIDYCINNNVGTLYIGHNNEWKQNCDLNKQNNQNFIQIPFNKLIQKIEYKCEEIGITVITINEAYSSKCSFLDNEDVCKHDNYLGKRIKRGLFRSNIGQLINSDVNGSLNILRLGIKTKVNKPNNVFNPIKIKKINELSDVVFFKWQPTDRGCVFQPNSSYQNEIFLI